MTVFCGPSGSRQNLARDGHDLRRGPAALRRKPQLVRPAVRRPDAEAASRPHRRPLAGHRHRAATCGHTPRSTVGTVTEIYDYFRILFARLGQPHCPECDIPIGTQTADEIVDKLLEEPDGTQALPDGAGGSAGRRAVRNAVGIAPRRRLRPRPHRRRNVSRSTRRPTIDRRRKHVVEVVIDRIIVRRDARSRIAGSIENALALGKGVVHVAHPDDDCPSRAGPSASTASTSPANSAAAASSTLSPHNFSFNSSLGWCPACEGLGTQTGANPAALLRDPKLTLAQGRARRLARRQPSRCRSRCSKPSRPTPACPATCRSGALTAPTPHRAVRHRRRVDRGLRRTRQSSRRQSAGSTSRPLFRFQFKGLYPALEEASRSRRASAACSNISSTRSTAAMRRQPAARRRGGRPLPRPHARRTSAALPLGELLDEVKKWKLAPNEKKVAGELIREVENRLTFLVDVGLDYLTLGRPPRRSPAAKPSASASPARSAAACAACSTCSTSRRSACTRATTRRLINALDKLRDLGNTLLVVEHDREVIAGRRRHLRLRPRRRPLRRPNRRQRHARASRQASAAASPDRT